MAQIELRNTTIYFQDGFTGTAAVNNSGGYSAGATSMDIDSLADLPDAGNEVFNGVRFTVAGETGSPIHTVTNHSGGPPTTTIDFTPPLASAVADDAVITFLPARIEIKVGDGNLTWTESKEYEYVLDRGNLQTVREGDQQPVEVKLDLMYEFYTNGSGGAWLPSPIDFLKRRGEAANLASSSSDPCEPFAIDIHVVYDPPCGSEPNEEYTFPDFRYETLEFDLRESSISVTGKCNAVEPTVTRTT
jgi:hypothetical protein